MNLISTLYQAWKLKLMEVHTPSTLRIIYAQRTIGLGMFCAIWYHFYNLKNLENTHGGVLFLVKLQAKCLYLY